MVFGLKRMETNYIVGWIPWPIATATAVWFSVMAHKSGKNVVLWAIGGGLLGLVLTTLVLGLGQAMFIPFYSAQVPIFRLKMTLVAILLVVCVGWLFTGNNAQSQPLRRLPSLPQPLPSNSLQDLHHHPGL